MNRSSHATKYRAEIDPSLYKYHNIIIQDEILQVNDDVI